MLKICYSSSHWFLIFYVILLKFTKGQHMSMWSYLFTLKKLRKFKKFKILKPPQFGNLTSGNRILDFTSLGKKNSKKLTKKIGHYFKGPFVYRNLDILYLVEFHSI